MAADQPASRLFCTVTGTVLLVLGMIGFFQSASFGEPGKVADALGFLPVNGWINVVHIALGALALLTAGFAPRPGALGGAIALGTLAVWGIALGSGDAILDRLPAESAENALHGILALLGLGAFIADRPPRKPKRDRTKRAERRKREERPKREERSKRDERPKTEGGKPESDEAQAREEAPPRARRDRSRSRSRSRRSSGD